MKLNCFVFAPAQQAIHCFTVAAPDPDKWRVADYRQARVRVLCDYEIVACLSPAARASADEVFQLVVIPAQEINVRQQHQSGDEGRAAKVERDGDDENVQDERK
jgi:hypothetical protein